MVATTGSTPKKCAPNARGGAAQAPVLLSPITVAHRSSMPEGDGVKKSNNWMRDQWVANLKKKRMAEAAANGGAVPAAPVVVGTGMNSSVHISSVGVGLQGDSGHIQTNRRHHNAMLEKNINAFHRNQHKHSQFATVDAPLMMTTQVSDHDAMTMIDPALLFNDLGFFEIESQSFAQVMSSPANQELQPEQPVDEPAQVSSRARATAKNPSQKKNPKPKKRATNCMALSVGEPRPRTPRRKLNTGDAFFDEFDSPSSSSSYSSVGTPSNFNADIRHMWGPEFDFGGTAGAAAFADTFLDLPTPKSTEMPFVSASCQQLVAPAERETAGTTKDINSNEELHHPRLIRTTSIEQEGLSHFLEQTNLDGTGHGEELFQMIATPKSTRTNTPRRQRTKMTYSVKTGDYSVAAAAGAAVNECFKMMPSPMDSKNAALFPTPRGLRKTPRGWYAGDFSFDQKNLEFETLPDEYKLADIDQELDSFYLDAMDSLSGELDLLSN